MDALALYKKVIWIKVRMYRTSSKRYIFSLGTTTSERHERVLAFASIMLKLTNQNCRFVPFSERKASMSKNREVKYAKFVFKSWLDRIHLAIFEYQYRLRAWTAVSTNKSCAYAEFPYPKFRTQLFQSRMRLPSVSSKFSRLYGHWEENIFLRICC